MLKTEYFYNAFFMLCNLCTEVQEYNENVSLKKHDLHICQCSIYNKLTTIHSQHCTN